MNCSICGRESAPNAKLCDDCRSARKRAFAATVTQPLLEAAGSRRSRASARLLKPSQSLAASARRASRKAKADAGTGESSEGSVRSKLTPIVLAAIVVGILALAYGAYKMRAPEGIEPPRSLETQVVPPPLNPKASLTPNVEVRTPTPDHEIKQDSSSTPAGTPELAKKPALRPKPAPPAPVAVSPVPEPAPAPVVDTPPPAPLVEAKPAPRADPFQALNDAIVACSHEDVPTRIRCEQGARVRYCKGNWGVAFQCPLGPNPDAQ